MENQVALSFWRKSTLRWPTITSKCTSLSPIKILVIPVLYPHRQAQLFFFLYFIYSHLFPALSLFTPIPLLCPLFLPFLCVSDHLTFMRKWRLRCQHSWQRGIICCSRSTTSAASRSRIRVATVRLSLVTQWVFSFSF